MSVKVAVRVRPFNDREIKGNSKCCVKMSGPTTQLVEPETGKPKTFTFDYSFWSHDQFEDNEAGVTVKKNGEGIYADQQDVYECLGRQVLDNAWLGYHCCLFAYGQTGSGKSYSMVGYGANKGIVPIACDEIFNRIAKSEADTSQNTKYQVQFSMLEIYNEKVQDLCIVDQKQKPTGGLKVRETPSGAVYVQGLSKYPVDSYEMILRKMDEGYNNRSIGSTLMNMTSSRAHTIITIEFKQVTCEPDGRKTEKLSVINLVDLAGSEKAGQTGATGDRLKEGCAINQSLTSLGICISVLADKAMGKQKKAVVPYRDSSLTRILQNALGGNSKTIMICAVSPADMNFEESLSTLRYADRAKKIQNKAVINESAQDKLIRELKTENEQLKKLLRDAASGNGKVSAQDFLDMMDHQEEQMSDMQNFDDKLKKEKELNVEKDVILVEKQKRENKRAPHLTNLNEDPQLSQQVYYAMTAFPVTVGRKCQVPPPNIIFGGVSVHRDHAKFIILDNGIIKFEVNATDEKAVAGTLVNGRPLKDGSSQILHHLDTIYFGPGQMLLFKYPLQKKKFEELSATIAGDDLSADELFDKQFELLVQSGVTTDVSQLICDSYTEDEITKDHDEVDCEQALMVIEAAQEAKRQQDFDKIAEQERQKAQQQFDMRQAEEKAKGEKITRELEEKQKQLEEDKLKQQEKLKEIEDKLMSDKQQLESVLNARIAEQSESYQQQEQKVQEAIEDTQQQAQVELEEARVRYLTELEQSKIEHAALMQQMKQEQERQKKAMQEQEQKYQKQLKDSQQQKVLQEKMKDIRKDITEANEIAKFMSKKIQLQDVYISKFDEGSINIDSHPDLKDEVQVKVQNFETGQVYMWSQEKFQDKLMEMRDALQTFEDGDFKDLPKEQDPFYEEPQPILVGQAYYMLGGLPYLLDNPRRVPIIAPNNDVYGEIHMNVIPCDENGNEDLDEEQLPDEPEALLNERLDFKVKIEKLTNLPEDFCRNIYCEYQFFMDEIIYKTTMSSEKNRDPLMDYEHHHSTEVVTKFLLDYLMEDKLTIKIYGTQDLKNKNRKDRSQIDSSLNSSKSTLDNSVGR